MELPVAPGAISVGRFAATLGLDRTQEYHLQTIERWGRELEPQHRIEAGDVLVYAATEKGVRALWRSPRFGLAPQKLYLASVAEGDFGMLIDLEQEGDLKMVAAQTDKPIRDTPADPGATCFVTTDSAESLAQHSELALWRDVVGRAPQPHKTRLALSILAAVIVCASFGFWPWSSPRSAARS